MTKEQVRNRNSKLRSFYNIGYICVILQVIILSFATCIPVEAKVYIDITSPETRKMMIAVYDFGGSVGNEISDIIRKDLTFTGFFSCADRNAYLESASQPFNPKNWTPLGIEAVVKGSSSGEKKITVDVALYDPFEGRAILNKQYQSEKELSRQLAHSVANDIYSALAGQSGIFRTKIAFIGEETGQKDIFVMDWDGQRMRKLGLKASSFLSPHWSPDGTKIIYSSEQSRQWGIFLLDFLRMTERRLLVSNGINIAGDFFPKGGDFVFSSSRSGTPDLYIFSMEDKAVRKITSTSGIDVSPAVSPDGNFIAFVSDRGGTPQIYMMRSDGTEVRRVTFKGSYNTSPNWAPSGERIVFSGRAGGKIQIFIIKPDGSDATQLTETGNNEDPSFSPDGRYITFCSDRDGLKGVYVMRTNGEAQTRVTPKGIKASGPRWSPN